VVYRLIDDKTSFKIEIVNKRKNTKSAFACVLHEPVKDTSLILENDDLHDFCVTLSPNAPMHLSFIQDVKEYAFEAKFDMVLIKNDVKLTEVTAIGVIKESSRRATKRFGVIAGIELYDEKDGKDMKPLYTGQSYDISCDAVSLLSNGDLELSDKLYYTRFKLFGKENFVIPARLLKKRPAPLSSFYRYEYVFLFDLKDDRATKNRLLDAFIINSIEARRA